MVTKWVVYSWQADSPAFCSIICVCDTEEQARKYADKYDEIKEVEYHEPVIEFSEIQKTLKRISEKELRNKA